jgi:hypothetical protein
MESTRRHNTIARLDPEQNLEAIKTKRTVLLRDADLHGDVFHIRHGSDDLEGEQLGWESFRFFLLSLAGQLQDLSSEERIVLCARGCPCVAAEHDLAGGSEIFS